MSLGSGLWVPVSVCLSESFGWNFADITLADDDINSIPADDANIGQFRVDGRHLDGGRAQCGVGKVVLQETAEAGICIRFSF